MEERAVVTCFLRHDGAVLLCQRSEEVGSYPGRWGAVAGHAEGDPDAAVRAEISEETGLDPRSDVTLAARGDPFTVVDENRGTQWLVHPYLFDCRTREVETNWETAEHAWVAPTAILSRATVPDLWRSYDRVRPTVETVAGDREHGSEYISLRALEVLRDEAALARHDGSASHAGDGWNRLADLAVSLRSARPSMPVVRNRVDRVMHAASADRTPFAVEHAATAGIDAALRATERVATHAASRVRGARVVTLSRSGTVAETLALADPEAVLVAESRPGSEGIEVARTLAETTDVTLTTDSALAHALVEFEADAVLVGADAVSPDGSVLNKVGTRSVAMAGTFEGIDVFVAAASDKVDTEGEPDLGARDPTELYDGDVALTVHNPTFDLTPADCLDAVVTEYGPLDAGGVRDVAARHRERAGWQEN